MKHNLSKSLMTSHLSSFQRIALAIVLTTVCLSTLPAHADDATAIRDHNNRGNALLARRLFQDAINEYETVLQIDPSHAVAKGNLALAHNEWGIWYYRYRKFKEAKEQWEIALKINPNDANVKRNLMLPSLKLAIQQQQNAPDAPPKPTGPQDWSPYDESLDKPQVKKPFSSAAASTPAAATPASGGGSGSETAASGTAPGSDSSSGASLVSTSATQVGGITSGASIVGSGGNVYSAQSTGGDTNTTGSIKNANGFENNSGSSGAVILSSSGSTANGNSNGAVPQSTNSSGASLYSGEKSGPTLSADVPTSDAPTSSVRIIGGSSDSASIIVGGAPSSSSSPSSYSGTALSGGQTANVFASPGTPKPPVNTVPGGSAPIRFTARPASGSVPMSWPGGREPAAQAPSARDGNPDSAKTPSFLSKTTDSESSEPDEEKSEDNSATVDDVLAKIENKVYGKVSKGMPILKRIERLEVETMGKKKSGSIADRLKELKETYGF